MSDEHQGQEEPRAATSGIAKALLGKVISHKMFSDRALYWILIAIAFLLPVFFIPGQFIAPEFAKMILLEALMFIGVFVWCMGRLRDGNVEIPKSMLLLVSVLLVIQFVVAAIFSPTPMLSFLGSGYDIGTVNSFIVLFLLMFIGSTVFSTRDRILTLYASFLLSGAVIMLYQLVRYFFGADFLDFGVFTSDVSTPVGKWNDMASLFGAMIILVLTTLYFFPQNKTIRLPAYALLLLGLFFLVLVDFTILWIILFVLLGLLVAFAVFEGEQTHKRNKHEAEASGGHHPHKPVHKRVAGHLPMLTVLFLIVAFIYGTGISTITWGNNNATIANVVANTLNAAPYSEIVLTPSFTYDIIANTLKESPLVGTGPNRFASGYLKWKTSDMNRTPFWDSTFDYGIGRIPTYFGTTGIIGMVLWLVFVVLIFMKARKILQLFAKDRIVAFLASSLFLLVLYFWSIAFVYLPNITVFALAFLFTGALIALMVGEGVLKRYRVEFGAGSKLSMVMTPLVIIVIVGIVSSGVLLYRQVSSLVAFRDAQLAMGVGNAEQAQSALSRANALSERDIYHRALSNLALVKLQQLAGQKLTEEEIATQAKALVVVAQSSATRAVALDPTNFENYLQLGGVYDTLGSLGIPDTAPAARENYEQALRLNPKSPRVLFVLSRLEFVSGNKEKAKSYLAQALAERPNFLEAISFMVQIEIQDKNPEAAIGVLQTGVGAEPSNFLLRFALGYLYFSKADYTNAISQFEAAVMNNPAYADAKYFLGLSYSKVDRTAEAIEQFTDVQTLNPDNKEVTEIIKNLKAGREPIGREAAPVTPVDDALRGLNEANGTGE